MKIKIDVMASDIHKSKAFVSYLMDYENNKDNVKVKNTKYELVIESEDVICKTVPCSDSMRGNKYHKLYIDSGSILNEEIIQNVFKYRHVPLRLHCFRPIDIESPIEYVEFSDYINK